MKIVFSNHLGLKEQLQKGFKHTPYTIAFADLTQVNVKDYDLVVALTISDLKYLNEIRDQVIANLIPIPTTASIVLCDEKIKFNQALIEGGFGEYIPSMGGKHSFPYILKKSVDYSSENSYVIYDEKEELSLSSKLSDPEYFTQAFIAGVHEYATHILFKDKKIITSVNIEYTFDMDTPIKGKVKHLHTTICHCPYLDLFTRIMMQIGFEGLCCFNYKVRDNRLYIIEINPRFGSSLAPYFFSFIKHLD